MDMDLGGTGSLLVEQTHPAIPSPRPSSTEGRLVGRLKQGDPAAFEEAGGTTWPG